MPMTQSVVAPHAAGRFRTISLLVALAPLWLLVVTATASEAFSVVVSVPPDVAGMPLGMVLEASAIVWMVAGVAVVWRAPSPLVESVALLVFTIPATVVAVLTPALIEVLRTL